MIHGMKNVVTRYVAQFRKEIKDCLVRQGMHKVSGCAGKAWPWGRGARFEFICLRMNLSQSANWKSWQWKKDMHCILHSSARAFVSAHFCQDSLAKERIPAKVCVRKWNMLEFHMTCARKVKVQSVRLHQGSTIRARSKREHMISLKAKSQIAQPKILQS